MRIYTVDFILDSCVWAMVVRAQTYRAALRECRGYRVPDELRKKLLREMRAHARLAVYSLRRRQAINAARDRVSALVSA